MKRAKLLVAVLGATALLVGLSGRRPLRPQGRRRLPQADSAPPRGTRRSHFHGRFPPTAGPRSLGYNIYKGTSAGGEDYASPVNGATLVTATDAIVTGLTNATTYYFTVKAVNANGASAASNEAWAIPAATVPGAPTKVVATGADASAVVTWTAPASAGGSNITRYTVTAADATTAAHGGQGCLWTTGALTCTLSGLTNGDSYSFTVTATNSLGTSVASVASNTVVPAVSVPAAPAGIVATPGGTDVAITWTAPLNGGSAITGYDLYEATTSGEEDYSTPVNGATLIPVTSTTVTGLTTGTKYYFTLKAVNTVGSSAHSAEVWAIPGGTVPGAPTHLAASRGVRRGKSHLDRAFELRRLCHQQLQDHRGRLDDARQRGAELHVDLRLAHLLGDWADKRRLVHLHRHGVQLARHQ